MILHLPDIHFRKAEVHLAEVSIDIRGVNGDAATFCACPHALGLDRRVAAKAGATGLAFWRRRASMSGRAESLCRKRRSSSTGCFACRVCVSSAALEVGWNALIAGYELRGAVIACDGAAS